MEILRRVMDDAEETPWYQFRPIVREIFVLLACALALSLVCFHGRPPHLPALIPGSEAKVLHTSQFDFTYPSRLRAAQLQDAARAATAPVYQVVLNDPANPAAPATADLYRAFVRNAAGVFDEVRAAPQDQRAATCAPLVKDLPGIPALLAEDAAALLTLAPNRDAFVAWANATATALELVLKNGVFERDPDQPVPGRGVERRAAARHLRDAIERAIANPGGTSVSPVSAAPNVAATAAPAANPAASLNPAPSVDNNPTTANPAPAATTATATGETPAPPETPASAVTAAAAESPAPLPLPPPCPSASSTTAAGLAPAPPASRALAASLTALFTPGLLPNVQVDPAATTARRELAASKIGEVRVAVRAGDVLLRPGEQITPVVLERWEAYRRELPTHEKAAYGPLRALEENYATALGVVLLAALFIHISPPRRLLRRQITLALLLVPANLLLIRLFLELGSRSEFLRFFGEADVLFWLAPPTLATILITLLAGPYLAILGAFAISIFSALMLGRTLDTFLITAIASLAAVVCCRDARTRADMLRAGAIAGAATALPVFFLGQTGGLTARVLLLQTGGLLIGGALTGILAIGLLPVLERLFKLTSNITFIELGDLNHPLLRKLQIIAPGTYNHSANVASLAGDAAARVGANALLCRCASLFHDIGKMIKPEYFIENQQAGNPHSDINPSMSAIVIKGHVREGITLAREFGLPRAIIDIIKQHHGTSLIQYFYHKARTTANGTANATNAAAAANGTTPSTPAEPTAVDEATFRYDGPKPLTREAAIVLFADSLEAASRSLKKVNHQTVTDLVNAIVSDRIKDGQLDESPLTFKEVQAIRESLRDSLMHMYHHRIEYPKDPTA